jgi:hypothetical protein
MENELIRGLVFFIVGNDTVLNIWLGSQNMVYIYNALVYMQEKRKQITVNICDTCKRFSRKPLF